MRIVPLILLGYGGVGRAFRHQIDDYGRLHPNGDPVSIQTSAIVTSTSVVRDGFPDDDRKPSDWYSILQLSLDVSRRIGVRPVIVDATNADNAKAHLAWVREGFTVVTANKRPLTGDYAIFKELTEAFDDRGHRSYWFEATVGAGLPVIRTLRELLETGDRRIEIRATPSGTLNCIGWGLENRWSFEAALQFAEKRGLTEPDPRSDLGGEDVRRKALILARLYGEEPTTRDFEPFISAPALIGEDWLERAGAEFEARHAQAARAARVPRYMLLVDAAGYRVGFSETAPEDAFGRLRGDENVFRFSSDRYPAREHAGYCPLTVSGRGAGHDVTATALFGDVLRSIARL